MKSRSTKYEKESGNTDNHVEGDVNDDMNSNVTRNINNFQIIIDEHNERVKNSEIERTVYINKFEDKDKRKNDETNKMQ
eukprot:5348059-Heterocapsa_arctica.AAC.1